MNPRDEIPKRERPFGPMRNQRDFLISPRIADFIKASGQKPR
jgi:hypothetical protein